MVMQFLGIGNRSASGATSDGGVDGNVVQLETARRRAIMLESQIELVQERLAELELASDDVGWSRLGGTSDVEFSFDYLKQIVARARLFYLNNPLINRAVSLQADYVFAQGLNIQAPDDDVNATIHAFVDDKRNKKELFGHDAMLMKEQTLMNDGNVFFVLFTDKRTGRVQLRSILVEEVVDIITNPDDANEIWYYKRHWFARDPDDITGTKLEEHSELYPDIDYLPPMNRRRASMGGVVVNWDAPIKHVKVGALAKSRYGVPETYSALDWAQAHRNFLRDWATIVRAYARFAFRLTVAGGKDSVVAAKNKLGSTIPTSGGYEQNPPPVAGSIFTTTKTNDDKLEPIKTAGATTSARDGRELRMMVAAALGIPDTFFGDVDVGNLATARTLDRPTELKYRSRQSLWTDVLTDIIEYQIRWAIMAPQGSLKNKVRVRISNQGTLEYDRTSDIQLHFEVKFPPILEHSIVDRINAVTEAVTLNGKQFAVDSIELQKLTLGLMFEALGLQNVDELISLVFKDVPNEPTAPPQPTTNPNTNPDGSQPQNPDNNPNQPGDTNPESSSSSAPSSDAHDRLVAG